MTTDRQTDVATSTPVEASLRDGLISNFDYLFRMLELALIFLCSLAYVLISVSKIQGEKVKGTFIMKHKFCMFRNWCLVSSGNLKQILKDITIFLVERSFVARLNRGRPTGGPYVRSSVRPYVCLHLVQLCPTRPIYLRPPIFLQIPDPL